MAKSPAPIKTDLFRFITTRTPQLIHEQKKKYGYIRHPNPEASVILSKGIGLEITRSRIAVQEAARQYINYVRKSEKLIEQFKDLYLFSQWLSKNKFTLTAEEIMRHVPDLTPIDDKSILLIWDNLIYQLVERNIPSVRQTCIQLIVSNYFVSTLISVDYQKLAEEMIQTPKNPYTPELEERIDLFLKRLAQSKIVIPKSATRARQEINGDNIKSDSDNRSEKNLKSIHYNTVLNSKQIRYQNIKSEIRQVGKQSNLGKTKTLSDIDISKPEIKQQLSSDSINYLSSPAARTQKLGDAETAITKRISQLSAAKKKYAKASDSVNELSYLATFEDFEGKPELYLTLSTGKPNAFIKNAGYEVKIGEDRPVSSKKVVELNYTENGVLTYRLTPDQLLKKGDASSFSLIGNLELNDSSTIKIDLTGSPHRTDNFGIGEWVPVELNTPVISPPLSSAQSTILYGVNNLGIGVYRKVEQEVCCYVPGEVSHIENILAREYKERHTRSLLSSESATEETTETETEKQSDTTSTNRYELQSEIANVLSKESSFGSGASLGVSSDLGGTKIDSNGNIDYASSNSSSQSDSEAATYAQEVTNKALERILQKTSVKRTTKILEEYEENNRHGFDNRKGTQHVTGVYRWIDIIYTNRLINYGKRLMVEFLIPEPARFYKKVLKKIAEAESESSSGGGASSGIQAPKSLSENGVESYEDINEENYAGLASEYGITVDEPLPLTVPDVTKSFDPSDDPANPADPNGKERSYNFVFKFSDTQDLSKYEAYNLTLDYNFDYKKTWSQLDKTYFILKVANETFRWEKNLENSTDQSDTKKPDTTTIKLDGTKNSLNVSVDINNVYDFAIILKVKLELSEEEVINWQKSVYNQLADAYNDQLNAYETAVEEEAAAQEAARAESEPESMSSDTCRQIEMREIQRIAIELLTGPFGIKVGRDFYTSTECSGVPKVKQNEQWLEYSSHVKFFEQAFDWNLMSYLFYPYYWAKKCDWIDLCSISTLGDETFLSFLQSGMARVVIPARQGFGSAITYYMETGDIWNGGGLVVETDDDLYLSIEEELIEIEGKVEDEWETRVPTTLTIVQGSSVYLEDEGLPCCDNVEDGNTDTLLRGSTTILGTGETTTVS